MKFIVLALAVFFVPYFASAEIHQPIPDEFAPLEVEVHNEDIPIFRGKHHDCAELRQLARWYGTIYVRALGSKVKFVGYMNLCGRGMQPLVGLTRSKDKFICNVGYRCNAFNDN